MRAANLQARSPEPESQEPDAQQQTHIPAADPTTSCVLVKREPQPSAQTDKTVSSESRRLDFISGSRPCQPTGDCQPHQNFSSGE